MKAHDLPEAVIDALSAFTGVELHLKRGTNREDGAEDFTRKFGRRIKNAGGTYSAMRGYSDTRFVKLPASETALIDEIMRWEATSHDGQHVLVNRKVTMIARGRTKEEVPAPWKVASQTDMAWITVHYWTPKEGHSAMNFLRTMVRAAVVQAIDRGIIRLEVQVANHDSVFLPTKPVSPLRGLLTDIAELLYEAEGALGGSELSKKLQGMRNGPLAETIKTL